MARVGRRQCAERMEEPATLQVCVRCSPAMAAGLPTVLCSMTDTEALIDAATEPMEKRGPHEPRTAA